MAIKREGDLSIAMVPRDHESRKSTVAAGLIQRY